jgi:replicative DNA helicase
VESQKNLLGQLLINNDLYYKLKINEEHFTGVNAKIYQVIKQQINDRIKANIMTVSTELKDQASYIASLTDIGTTANWRFYEKQIIKEYQKQGLMNLTRIIQDGIKKDPNELMEDVKKELDKLEETDGIDEIKSFQNEINNQVRQIEKMMDVGGVIPGIKTGINALDGLILGFEPELMYVIGGRPSMGKTALMINMILAATDQGYSAGVISLESSTSQLINRAIANRAKINLQNIKTGLIDKEKQFKKIIDAAEDIYNKQIYIYDKPNATIQEVKYVAKTMRKKHNIDILFIDYHQIIQHRNKSLNKLERISTNSLEVKNIGRELGIPVVDLAQLKRECEEKRPTNADLADSSQLEKDADVTMMLHKTDSGKKDLRGNIIWNYWVIVTKARDGVIGAVPIIFEKEYIRIQDDYSER